MIWQSMTVMTLIDIIIIAVTAYGLYSFIKTHKFGVSRLASRGAIFVLIGLIIFGGFYAVDLFSMHLLPQFIPAKESMAFMRSLHLNYSWIAFSLSIGFIVLGFTWINQNSITMIKSIEESQALLLKTQASLLRSERLATLGQLSATISHELRNPLGTIRTSMVTISDRTQNKGLGVERALERIERNILRCDNIITQLLDYARDREPNKKLASVDQVITDIISEMTVSEAVTLKMDLNTGAQVQLDPEGLRHVVINLVENAVQAMDAGGADSAPGEHALSVSSRINGSRVEVTFADTGPGITPDNMAKIFEPLFSTKTYGVGLGLPLVKKILEQHDGGIQVTSAEGQGTQFVLWLPCDPCQ